MHRVLVIGAASKPEAVVVDRDNIPKLLLGPQQTDTSGGREESAWRAPASLHGESGDVRQSASALQDTAWGRNDSVVAKHVASRRSGKLMNLHRSFPGRHANCESDLHLVPLTNNKPY